MADQPESLPAPQESDVDHAVHDAVESTFAEGGALAQANPGFKPRQGQTAMARAVAETIAQGGALAVEAGTGVGKTFAYLVPTLLSGERALVSTATKALQDQIFQRDLPFLRKALGISLNAALLKGRSSYLCPYRLELAESDLDGASQAQVRWVGRVRRWANTTQTGDMSEMPGFQERSPYLPLVTSTLDNCLGGECPQFAQCYVNKARKKALAADLVVINHHLFFADLEVRKSGVVQLLPSVRAIVIDEAHQFNETGVAFLGENWGSRLLQEFARETLRTCKKIARGLGDWEQLVFDVDAAAKRWQRCLGDGPNRRLNWYGAAPEGVDAQEWQAALQEQADTLLALKQALDPVADSAPELLSLYNRCVIHETKARFFAGPAKPSRVRWVEIEGLQIRLIESPLDIAEDMRVYWGLGKDAAAYGDADIAAENETQNEAETVDAILGIAGQGGGDADSDSKGAEGNDSESNDSESNDPDAIWREIAASLHDDLGDISAWESAKQDEPEWQPPPVIAHKAWIFTSATLGADPQLSHFTEACGLEGARVLQVPSPFNYARQSMLYVPQDMPDPKDVQAHGQAVAALAAQGAQVLGGRTLVLTTTLKALQHIGQLLRQQLLICENIEVLIQGEQSKQRLMEQFRQPAPGKGHVLVASASFWEGFDVPGDALQLVVIDKLPFPPPHDPLVQARAQRCQQQGENPFSRLFVPEAAIALKQGAGRLIRTETDKGILALCDPRVLHKAYGRQLLASLPPMARMRSAGHFAQALQRLAAANGQALP